MDTMLLFIRKHNATRHQKGPNIIWHRNGHNATRHKKDPMLHVIIKGPNIIRYRNGHNATRHKNDPMLQAIRRDPILCGIGMDTMLFVIRKTQCYSS